MSHFCFLLPQTFLCFTNYRIPRFDRANARQTGGQIDRWVRTDRRGKNPWLWSIKQCQMLLVKSIYNHFVRHGSLRTSKYILYTRVKSVTRTLSQTSGREGAHGESDDHNCTKRYSGGHVYCKKTTTTKHSYVRTYIHTLTHHPPPSYTRSRFTFDIGRGGLIFRP